MKINRFCGSELRWYRDERMGLRLVIPSLRRMVRQPVDVVLGSWRRHKWRPHYLLPFCCETSLKIESQHLWEGLSRCGGASLKPRLGCLAAFPFRITAVSQRRPDCFGDLTPALSPSRDSCSFPLFVSTGWLWSSEISQATQADR